MTNLRRFTLWLTAFATVAIPGLQSNAQAQAERKINQKDLPKAVRSAFEKAYPKAVIKGISAEKGESGKMEYEIESIEGKTFRDVAYFEDGKVIEIEETCVLPNAIRLALDQMFPKGKVEKTEKITRGSTIEYEAVVEVGKKKNEAVLDQAGKIIKVRKMADEKGEKKTNNDTIQTE